MRKRIHRRALGLASSACLCSLLLAGGADARVEAVSDYTKAQTYSGALRYLRTALDYEVVEKDADAAYLIFKYQRPGQKAREAQGTLEIVEAAGKVRLFVQLPEMPEYHERVLCDGLLKKLRDEYGAPRKSGEKAPTKPAGDAGAR
ncbi:MAG TPA: hypothetical protein VI072_33420 [Polyangiaceae bacterium]